MRTWHCIYSPPPIPSYTPVPTPSPIYYDWDHNSPYYKPTPTPSSYNYKIKEVFL